MDVVILERTLLAAMPGSPPTRQRGQQLRRLFRSLLAQKSCGVLEDCSYWSSAIVSVHLVPISENMDFQPSDLQLPVTLESTGPSISLRVSIASRPDHSRHYLSHMA